MKRSLNKLRLAEVGDQAPFARLWNRLVDEVERAVNLTVHEPLLLRDDDLQGRNLSLRKPVIPGAGVFPVSANPWEIFQWTPAAPAESACVYTYWRNVRVHLGYVNGQTTDQAKFVHEMDAALPTGANAGSNYDILVPASTTAYKIWGYVDYTRVAPCMGGDDGLTINHIKIESGTSWWTGHPAQFPSAGKFYFEIGTVTTTADQLPFTDCPTNTVPNGSYPPVLTINQIIEADIVLNPPAFIYGTAEMDGGDPGDETATCDFTYKFTDTCGNILLATATPAQARIANIPYTQSGGPAVAAFDGSGAIKLLSVFSEVPESNEYPFCEDDVLKNVRLVGGDIYT